MKQRVTIADVAKVAGVSKQTVSRAINDKGEIKEETRQRILAVVRDLGYRPNRLAQAMGTQRSHMVGLVVPDITNPFFPEVARGVQDAALLHQYSALINNTDERGDREIEMLEQLAAQGVDGIITFSHRASDEALARFAGSFRPIVMINRQFSHPNVVSIMVNNAKGARLAVEHFVSRGHRHIGMLTNADFSPSTVRRVQGFQQALQKHGLEHCAERLVGAEASFAGGYAAASQLLLDFTDTTAIFCYNDLMAIGAIRAMQKLGKRVPDDVSIIGFDNIHFTSMVSPSLSTIHMDKHEIGRVAFERVLLMRDHPNTDNRTIEIDVKLILRDSTES